MPESARYYDNLYRGMVLNRGAAIGWDWLNERIAKVVPLIIGDSVLDIGCGLGIIADCINRRRYFGIDFSRFAIEWSRHNIKNPNAQFAIANVENFCLGEQYDTVLLLEVLEHVANPDEVAQLAEFYTRKRLIVTVPRDMPGRGHIKHRWDKSEIRQTFGIETECSLFGGPDNNRWWLAVRDYEEKN